MSDDGQIGLFGDDDELGDPEADSIGGFHGPDSEAPDTERLGAIEVYPRSGTQRRLVLEAIAEAGFAGCTDDELRLGLNIWRAQARREELKRAGWVEDSGLRRPTSVNGRGAVWRLTPRGRSAYAELTGAPLPASEASAR